MEYLPLGNLDQQHQVSRITEWEIGVLLCQGLEVLDFLHSQKLVHRDLKPENILIQRRETSDFRIKIADFGIAGDESLVTCCGTRCYSAPEIWKGSPYTAKVDVWSLGLIVFQYAYGLPKLEGRFDPGRWYTDLTDAIENWNSDALIGFLASSMLTTDPERRLSASECLEEFAELCNVIIPAQNIKPDPGTPTERMSSSAIMEAFRDTRSAGGPEVSTAVKTHIESKSQLSTQRDVRSNQEASEVCRVGACLGRVDEKQ